MNSGRTGTAEDYVREQMDDTPVRAERTTMPRTTLTDHELNRN
jgi:hypothetical protein